MSIRGTLDKFLRKVGLIRHSRHMATVESFRAARITNLTLDWATAPLSADQEIRSSLRQLRARSRELCNNNDYAERFMGELEKNVIGPNGMTLQSKLPDAEAVNREIEASFARYAKFGVPTVCGKMSLVDFGKLWIRTLGADGEVFVRHVRNFPHNEFGFAVQLIDADQVDVQLNRPRGHNGENEIRMGIEVDEWGRNVAFHVFSGHPSEVGGGRRMRIPADEIKHTFLFRRANQNRGLPFMHTAMSKMNMLCGYEEAELIASRLASCKMAFVQSDANPEQYTPGERDKKTGTVAQDARPGTIEQLPPGTEINTVDWNHPNAAYAEFTKAMVRGMAIGMGISYATLSGDLREVNFSSIRQGVLSERDAWKCLQTFAITHLFQPLFEQWFAEALLRGKLQLSGAISDPKVYFENIAWQGVRWPWVDPLKDIEAAVVARRAGIASLQDACSAQGRDFREVIDQIAIENEYAAKRGVTLDFSGSGMASQPDAEQNNTSNTLSAVADRSLRAPQGVM